MQANHLMGNNERPGTDEQPATGGQRARDEQPCSIKKGWRFYGTLSTLALLNFICAVDATILAVALPVSDRPHILLAVVLIISADDRHRSKRHNSYTGFLGWHQFSLVRVTRTSIHSPLLTQSQMFSSIPAELGILFTRHRAQGNHTDGIAFILCRNCDLLRR